MYGMHQFYRFGSSEKLTRINHVTNRFISELSREKSELLQKNIDRYQVEKNTTPLQLKTSKISEIYFEKQFSADFRKNYK